jgi:hypothetical protein
MTLVHSTSSITLPYSFISHTPFKQISTHILPLPSQMLCFMILLMLYHSLFLSVSAWVPQSRSTITNIVYIWVCVGSCLLLCICLWFGSIFHLWEKTCGFCPSEPSLLHLTWCPPVAFIFLQTTCHYSLWPSNTSLCIYSTFSWSIHQLKVTWVVSIAWLLWIVLWWTSVCRCLYLSCPVFLWVDVQEWNHWIIWLFYLWIFEKSLYGIP